MVTHFNTYLRTHLVTKYKITQGLWQKFIRVFHSIYWFFAKSKPTTWLNQLQCLMIRGTEKPNNIDNMINSITMPNDKGKTMKNIKKRTFVSKP